MVCLYEPCEAGLALTSLEAELGAPGIQHLESGPGLGGARSKARASVGSSREGHGPSGCPPW